MSDYEKLYNGFQDECWRYWDGLTSFEAVCGYMQALVDLGILGVKDIKYLISWLQDTETTQDDWREFLENAEH